MMNRSLCGQLVRVVVLGIAGFVLVGCATPKQIAEQPVELNRAQEESHNALLLMNIVRAYQRKPMHFMRIATLRGTLSPSSIGLTLATPIGGDATSVYNVSTALTFTRPTVEPQILDSQEFMRGITTLADDLLCTTVLACASAGTLDTAGYAVTADRFSSAGSGASTYLKGSMVTITGAGTAWDFSAGALSAGTSTIKFTNVSAAGRTFAGGGKSYHDVWFSGGYAGILQIAGSNSFNDFRSDAGLHTIQFPVGGTQTVGPAGRDDPRCSCADVVDLHRHWSSVRCVGAARPTRTRVIPVFVAMDRNLTRCVDTWTIDSRGVKPPASPPRICPPDST